VRSSWTSTRQCSPAPSAFGYPEARFGKRVHVHCPWVFFSCFINCCIHTKRASLHPASVVRPSQWKIGENGENRRPGAAGAVARRGDGNRRKVRASIVVHVKAAWASTKLGAISRADHGTITRGCRSAVIGDGGTAIFRKRCEWLQIERIDSTNSTRERTPHQQGGNPRRSRYRCNFGHCCWKHRQGRLLGRPESSLPGNR
jgi:hypothetical protein